MNIFIRTTVLVGIVTFLCLNVLAQSPQKFALVIGIKGYPNFPPDEKLEYADNDAGRFAEFIKTSEGGNFPRTNVHVLINEGAKRGDILREINWLRRVVDNDDLVYIFFAGHGIVDDLDHAYLMPYDADKAAPNDRGIRVDQFLRDLKVRVSAKHMVLFIDACHAGSILMPDGTARGGDNVIPTLTNEWEREFRGRQGVTMGFFSAQGNQRSWEDKNLRHGLFTYYLVEGMKGGADEDRNGVVEARELYRYLIDQVESHSRKRFTLQSPLKSPIFDPSFPMAIHRPETPSGRPGLLIGDSSGINISVVDERARPVSGVALLLIYSDGTYLHLTTDSGGKARAARLKQTVISVYAAHKDFSAYYKDHVQAGREMQIQLGSRPLTGSVVCLSTCHIPNLNGWLNPILDSLNRKYLYADNIAIEGGKTQPVDFELNRPIQVEDSQGNKFALRIVSMIGRSSLIEYTQIN
jgi:hypothetical protein